MVNKFKYVHGGGPFIVRSKLNKVEDVQFWELGSGLGPGPGPGGPCMVRGQDWGWRVPVMVRGRAKGKPAWLGCRARGNSVW